MMRNGSPARWISITALALGLTVSSTSSALGNGSGVVCDPSTGHCYEYVAGPLNWDAAKAAAEARTHNGVSGHLATLTSQAETDFIVANVPAAVVFHHPFDGGAYIGAYQLPGSTQPLGGWQWVTGEPWSYTNWAGGEPNNSGGTEDVANFWSTAGHWNDVNRTLAKGYLVEYPAPPVVTVFASGTAAVTTWDPIFPASALHPFQSQCTATPSVGPNANWVNPHAAFAFALGSHPWEDDAPFDFAANWINAWSDLNSRGPSGQNWTKYSTAVTGQGDFVLQFLADNCSWIYLNDQLVGVQDHNWSTNGTGRYTISLTGPGPHELSFIIWDGGGLAGGKFRLETVQSFQDNNPGDPLPPPPPPSDTTPPVIGALTDIVAEATQPGGAFVTFTVTAEDDVDGTVDPVATPASNSLFPIGATPVTVTATDSAGNSSEGTFTVTVEDTTPPVITSASGNLTAEATSAAGATVNYDGATATDAVGVASLTYSHASGSTFPIGPTTVTVTATDAAGNSSQASFTVTVQDTTAPALGDVTPSQATLWPPNHQMVAIDVSAAATDAVGVTSLTIISVTSSEPDNGLGDGDTVGDIVITGPLSVNLRAERSGRGNGRTYTITVEARDAAGNASTKTCTVFVPRSQGRR